MPGNPWGLAVCALLLDEQGRFLLVKRAAASKHWAGDWELPGGKVEPGEQIDVAVQREVEEETGLVIILDGVVGATSFELPALGVAMLCFHARVRAGDVRISSEHEEFRWIKPAEVLAMKLRPIMRDLLATPAAQALFAQEQP